MNSQRNLNSNLIQRNPGVIQNQHKNLQQSVLMAQGKQHTPNIGDTNKHNKTESNKPSYSALSNISSIQSVDSKQSNPNQTYINQLIQPPPPPPSAMSISSQPRTLLPRPIINPNRSIFDKLLDFMIGEGPNNR
jgi:hypothetical protein